MSNDPTAAPQPLQSPAADAEAAAPTPAPAPAPAPAAGGAPTPPAASAKPLFQVRVGRADGAEFKGEDCHKPTHRAARCLIMDLNLVDGGEKPTQDLMDMYAAIGRIADVLDHLYPASKEGTEALFRPYFVSLFHLARLALEGDPQPDGRIGSRLAPELAKNELLRIERALIDDEEARIKNEHLRQLGHWILVLSAPLALAYVVLSAASPGVAASGAAASAAAASSAAASATAASGAAASGGVVHTALALLQIDAAVLARYCLLWIGCFVGVGLSYAYRKPRLALEDLIAAESDRLSVPNRLILAGLSTMLLVMLCAFGLIDFGIGGTLKLSTLSSPEPYEGIAMFAFVVGVVCGVGELALAEMLSGKLKSVLPGAGK